MDNLKEKIGIILVYTCLLLTILLCICIFPYKEILKCRDNYCYVERLYIFFNNRSGAYYDFNKTDDIQVIYNAAHTRRGISYYSIDNISDYNYSIFENGFASKDKAQEIVSKIKSCNNLERITKYWFGYKIENMKGIK